MPSFALTVTYCGTTMVYMDNTYYWTFDCSDYYIPIDLGPFYYNGYGIEPYGYGGSGSSNGNNSSSLPVNGSSTPNSAINCNSPNTVKNNEVKRLYIRSRNDFFNNNPNSTLKLNWLNNNQLFDIDWNAGFGSYIIMDATFNNSQLNTTSNNVSIVSEESCY